MNFDSVHEKASDCIMIGITNAISTRIATRMHSQKTYTKNVLVNTECELK